MKFLGSDYFKIFWSKNVFLVLILISFTHCIRDSSSAQFFKIKHTQDENLYKFYENYFNPQEENHANQRILINGNPFLYSNLGEHHVNLNQLGERQVFASSSSSSSSSSSFSSSSSSSQSFGNPGQLILFAGAEPELKPLQAPSIATSCDKKNGRIKFNCDKNDIYCMCRNHPNYKQCVCSAYPKSIICSDYCLENTDDYFCNPNRCSLSNEIAKCDKCFCKFHPEDIKCKCKSNPYTRDCFCLKFPLSHLCNPNACKFNPNSLFCSCQTNLRENMCTPRFCHDNPNSPYCKCIVDPYSHECSCLNDPNSCTRKEFMESIVEFDLKIRDVCANNKLFYSQNPFRPINDTNLNNTNLVIYDNNNHVSVVDPRVIFNMYYPPCDYNPDDPTGKLKNEPCIPFPDPPKPCNGADKDISKNLMLKKPCVYSSEDGTCLRDMAALSRASVLSHSDPNYRANLLRNVNNELAIKKNEDNLKNVKIKFGISDEEHSFLMLYNKILLFNQVKCQKFNNKK